MLLAKAIADKAGVELAKACKGKTVAKGEILRTAGFTCHVTTSCTAMRQTTAMIKIAK